MENLKIKVSNNVCEITELFVQYGCKYFNHTCTTKDYAILRSGKVFFCKKKQALILEDCREISIEQLHDMVVLKRNNVGDATHNFHGLKFFLSSDEKVYQFMNTGWFETDDDHKIVCRFPIQNNDLPFIDSEEDMREFLEKQEDGSYKLITSSVNGCIDRDWIEVPEGATMYAEDSNMGVKGNYFFRLRSDDFDYEAIWLNEQWMNAAFDVRNMSILWQRGGESLNDKVASAEEARQKQPNKKTIDVMDGVKLMESLARFNNTYRGADFDNFELFEKHSHYKKDVSQLEFIDVYRVLDLFEVESHAVGHAIKKLLCSGQRGAKDKAQDIQEAIDSLNRELEMMRENDNS